MPRLLRTPSAASVRASFHQREPLHPLAHLTPPLFQEPTAIQVRPSSSSQTTRSTTSWSPTRGRTTGRNQLRLVLREHKARRVRLERRATRARRVPRAHKVHRDSKEASERRARKAHRACKAYKVSRERKVHRARKAYRVRDHKERRGPRVQQERRALRA